jgi:hypothetical protein
MDMRLELFVLLTVVVLAQGLFGRFEIETPAWRRLLKWTIVIGGTLALYTVVGHWSLLLPLAMLIAGTTFHFIWCRRHGIDPIHATPARRYYELRGWRFPE